jgi:hypothetical protein
MTVLPGGTSAERLAADLRRHLGRPALVVEQTTSRPLGHQIATATTAGLTRVRADCRDGDEQLSVHLVVKGLHSARHGLPPSMPPAVRARLDRLIPWRLEADAYAADLGRVMPPGLRMPDLVAVHEQDDDRLTLWLLDVDPLDTPWTDDDISRAATGLARLAVRRADLPSFGAGDFLLDYRDRMLGEWAVPRLLMPESWDHPLFALPEVAALRAEVTALAGRVAAVHADVAAFPRLPAHGDATPMNLLRPRSAPEEFVLIDWGTATDAPIGYDLVPLVFGRAESGLAPPGEVPGLLGTAVGAYTRGLAAEGVHVSEDVVRRAVVSAAMVRYPCTGLPVPALDGEPVDPGRAVAKAGFVRMVLDLGRELAG